MVICEDGDPRILSRIKNSEVGKLLQKCNMEGYIYMNQAANCYTPRKIKVKNNIWIVDTIL